MPRIVLCLCALAVCLRGQAPTPAQPELERMNSLIEELTTLKAQVAAVEGRLDALLRGLSEQRGALQNKPAFNALKNVEADTPADPKKPAVRCAALTGDGKRCSRAAVDGARYCRQHQLAHTK
jgi:hypothetical protein